MYITINYLAIIVAAVANMILGALWFGPLFGKQWMRATFGSAAAAKAKMENAMEKGMGMSYGLMGLGSLVMAFTLSRILAFGVRYLGLGGLSLAFSTSLFLWVGLVVPITIGVVLWDGKSWGYWALTYTYYLVGFLLMSSILTFWM